MDLLHHSIRIGRGGVMKKLLIILAFDSVSVLCVLSLMLLL